MEPSKRRGHREKLCRRGTETQSNLARRSKAPKRRSSFIQGLTHLGGRVPSRAGCSPLKVFSAALRLCGKAVLSSHKDALPLGLQLRLAFPCSKGSAGLPLYVDR